MNDAEVRFSLRHQFGWFQRVNFLQSAAILIRPDWRRRRFAAVVLAVASASHLLAADPPYCQPPKQGQVYVIAHRGVHRQIPENTLAAYQRAIEIRADFVEIDVRTTQDGALVSIHNNTVDAYVTDGTRGKVRDFTLRQLQALDIGSRVGPQWRDQRVPTIDEVLALCKDKIGVYLDIKDASLPQVAERIKEHRMQRQAVWCIAPGEVAQLRRACPACIAMPDPESEVTLPAMLQRTRASIVAPVWRDFSSTFSDKCHAEGALVFVDELKPTRANWQLALEWGADGIQTDDPVQLIEFLRHRAALPNSDAKLEPAVE